MVLKQVNLDLVGGSVDDLGFSRHADGNVRREDCGVPAGIDRVARGELELERDLLEDSPVRAGTVPCKRSDRPGIPEPRADEQLGVEERDGVGIVAADRIDYPDHTFVGDYAGIARDPVLAAFVDDQVVVLGVCAGLDDGGGDVVESVVRQYRFGCRIGLSGRQFVAPYQFLQPVIFQSQLVILSFEGEVVGYRL